MTASRHLSDLIPSGDWTLILLSLIELDDREVLRVLRITVLGG